MKRIILSLFIILIASVSWALPPSPPGAASGAAETATALAANPEPCGAGSFVTDIAADGTLTCNASWAAPGTIGSGTPSSGAFTTWSAGSGGATCDADGDCTFKSVTVTAGASPAYTFFDSDGAGADKESAKILVNMETTTDGSEDGKMSAQVMVDGSEVTGIEIDGNTKIITTGNGGAFETRQVNVKSATNEHWSGQTLYFAQCAASLAFGTPVYIQSTGKPAGADADAAATMPAIGLIVVASTDADTPCTVLTHGVITDTDWEFTPGTVLYVSETVGSIETAVANISDTNDVVQVLGVAIHADSMFVNPSLTTIVLE